MCWRPGQPNPFGQVSAVIALWGVTQGAPEALVVNTDLALSAQELARASGAGRVLHCSSVAVYAPKSGLLDEKDPTSPVNAYGQAKLDMERALAHADGPEPTILRIGSVAGAESLAASIRRGWAAEAAPVHLDRFQDGNGPERSYIAPSDLARGLVRLATQSDGLPTVLNVGAPAPVRMEALLKAVNHPHEWRPAPATVAQSVTMNCDRFTSLTGMPASAADPGHIIRDWLTLEERA